MPRKPSPTKAKKGSKKVGSFGHENDPTCAIKNGVAAQHHSTPAPITNPQYGEAKPKHKAGPGWGRSSLSDEQRQKALALLELPKPPIDAEIARQIGCSVFAIRHLKTVAGEVSKRVLTVYERRFIKELPPIERVKVYSAIARGDIDAKRAFSALKSLQRIEELEGIVTKREQKEAESHAAPQAAGPVFVIQGAQINVGHDDIKPAKGPVVDVEAKVLESDNAGSADGSGS